MGYFSVILLIIAGIASISTFIVSKKPDLKDEMEKLTQYSGYVGVVLLIIGVITFFGGMEMIAWWKTFKFLDAPGNILVKLSFILFSPICIILGFIQGYALIDQYVLNKAKGAGDAGEKFDNAGDATYKKLAKYSIPFGFIGIAVALILLLARWGVF